MYFYAKPVSCNYYSHRLCNDIVIKALCDINVLSHSLVFIILICMYFSSPGQMREELAPFMPPSAEKSLSLAEEDSDNSYYENTDDISAYRTYCQAIIYIANHQKRLTYSEMKSVCHVCRIYRHPALRAGHCKQIQRCIPHYDHYCVFLGKVIGKDNFIYFMAFLLCMGLISMPLTLYIYTEHYRLYAFMNKGANYLSNSSTRAYFIIEYSIWVFLMWCYVIILLIFHVFLALRGLSTREFLSKHYDEYLNLTCHPVHTDTEMIGYDDGNGRKSVDKQNKWTLLRRLMMGTVMSVMLVLCFSFVLILVPEEYLESIHERFSRKNMSEIYVNNDAGKIETVMSTVASELSFCQKYIKLLVMSTLREVGLYADKIGIDAGSLLDIHRDVAVSVDSGKTSMGEL